ncbi:hypothetical protein STAS_17904 [Striga asiatica]|uniref:DUF1985 domain-containing protein n=1 Tax=Striga asiatica TaxID=4170 RepID=A0A5A7Q7F7_STRAF|nr:hypothetical protein STAS_17904 [Striga asiatica]
MKGNMRKPRMAKRGPAAWTAGSSPKMRGIKVSFLAEIVGAVVVGSSAVCGGTKKEYAFDIPSKCKAVVTNRCNLNVVSDVLDNLDKAHKKRFVKSCFRPLVNIPELILSSQVVHQVLRRTLKASENDKDAVWFRFGENEVRFGLQEFCLVTGFKIAADDENAYEVPKNNSSLLQLFKKKRGKIKRSDLLEEFHKVKDAEAKYKLGLVTVLEHVVLSAECETLVDERWFDLVEDLEKFNSYPWGNLSYQQTIWAFKALPDLGREFAEKKIGFLIPRMYGWKIDKQCRGEQLNTFFDRAEIEVRRTLELSSYEVKSSYLNELGIIAKEVDSARQDEDEEGTATKVEEEGNDDDDVVDDEEEKEDEEEEEEEENASQRDPPQPHVLDEEKIAAIVRKVVKDEVRKVVKEDLGTDL